MIPSLYFRLRDSREVNATLYDLPSSLICSTLYDALMKRSRGGPLPSGTLEPLFDLIYYPSSTTIYEYSVKSSSKRINDLARRTCFAG